MLESNQTATLHGRWRSSADGLVIPIAISKDQFSDAEIKEIFTAVGIWNRFFAKTKKNISFDFGEENAPHLSERKRSLFDCPGSLLNEDQMSFKDAVVIYKLTKWTYTSAPSAIAMTASCKPSAHNLSVKAYNFAQIDLNYEHFFSEGKPIPDLVTNIVHELGHVVGLNHSCGGTSSDFISCEDASLPAEYKDAVMFPYDYSADGQLKKKLKTNDQQRVNCLYGANAFPWEN